MLCFRPASRGSVPISKCCQQCRLLRRPYAALATRSIASSQRPSLLSTVVHEDGHRALRERRHGNKSLPLPPHMDPVRVAQRNKWKDTKASPPKREYLTEFQKALKSNVYGLFDLCLEYQHTDPWKARALATPVRQCTVTAAHLPSFFLLPFTPVAHSETHSTAILPVDLFHAVHETHESAFSAVSRSRRRSYLQLRRSLLDHVLQDKSWRAVLGHQEREDIKYSQLKNITWRTDMREFVSGMLRDLAFKEVRKALDHPLDISLELVANPARVDRPEEVEVLLTTRPNSVESLEELLHEEEQIDTALRELEDTMGPLAKYSRKEDPFTGITIPSELPRIGSELIKPQLEFPVTEVKGYTIPVYHLRTLLGEERCQELFGDLTDEKPTFMVARRVSGEQTTQSRLHEALLKLQMFYARP